MYGILNILNNVQIYGTAPTLSVSSTFDNTKEVQDPPELQVKLQSSIRALPIKPMDREDVENTTLHTETDIVEEAEMERQATKREIRLRKRVEKTNDDQRVHKNNDEEGEAPTVQMMLHKAKQTIENLKEKITSLEEERNYLGDRLKDALELQVAVQSQMVSRPALVDTPEKYPEDSGSKESDSDSTSDTSGSEPSPKKMKKKKHNKKKSKSKAKEYKRVKTPEESIQHYYRVLGLVKGGATKSDAYNTIRVDRNTIVYQAAIAELAAANPDMFKVVRARFKKGDSLQRFADKCKSQCILEPNAGVIVGLKQANDLLDIK